LLSNGNDHVHGPLPTSGFADPTTGGGGATSAAKWRQQATTPAIAALVPSWAAGSPPECAREVLWWWVVSCGEGASTAVVRQSAVQLQLERLVGGRAAWVVAGWCADSNRSILNSDASSLLYRPAEDHHLYTAKLGHPCWLIARCTLCHALCIVCGPQHC